MNRPSAWMIECVALRGFKKTFQKPTGVKIRGALERLLRGHLPGDSGPHPEGDTPARRESRQATNPRDTRAERRCPS